MLYPKVTERSRDTAFHRATLPAARVALVTGGSRGLGSAIARRLACDGLAVAVHATGDEHGARAVVRAIRDEGGVAAAFRGDVGDERQAAKLATAVAGSLGHVDVLVVNATDARLHAPLERIARVLRRALLPGMEVKGAGRIVTVDADVVEPAVGLTAAWSRELAPLGITVNAVAPRFVAPARDVAHAVSFVAAPDAGFITGQRIVVDGGRGPVA